MLGFVWMGCNIVGSGVDPGGRGEWGDAPHPLIKNTGTRGSFRPQPQGPIKTNLGLMLLPGKGPIFFSAFKTDQEVQDP